MAQAQKPDFVFRARRMSPFKSAGASVQSTTGSRGVPISGSNAGYTMFRGSVMGTGYPFHSPVSPSLPLPCVTVCQHISTGLYHTLIPFLISHVRQVFLAAGAFTVTPNRKALINFTMPISIQTTTFLTARPGEVSRALIFMAPFTYDVSNCILCKPFMGLELSSSSSLSETSDL